MAECGQQAFLHRVFGILWVPQDLDCRVIKLRHMRSEEFIQAHLILARHSVRSTQRCFSPASEMVCDSDTKTCALAGPSNVFLAQLLPFLRPWTLWLEGL